MGWNWKSGGEGCDLVAGVEKGFGMKIVGRGHRHGRNQLRNETRTRGARQRRRTREGGPLHPKKEIDPRHSTWQGHGLQLSGTWRRE